jgi:hypothetical protein
MGEENRDYCCDDGLLGSLAENFCLCKTKTKLYLKTFKVDAEPDRRSNRIVNQWERFFRIKFTVSYTWRSTS